MHCAVCNKPTTTQCSRCKAEHYCSRACQQEHWRVHKPVCRPPPPGAAAAVGSRTPLCGQGFRKWLEARSSKWRRVPELREEPTVGFTNWRNNCYLNAVYQCLLHTPLLRDHMLSTCPTPQDEWLAELAGLYRLVEEAQHRDVRCVDPPQRLSRLVAEASTEFALGRQADAHEAFILLITRWLNGCLVAGDGTGRDLSKLEYKEKEQLEAGSLVGHVFGLQNGQCMTCESCNYESKVSSVEYCLILNVTLGMTQEELQRCQQDSMAQLQLFRRRPSGGGSSESNVSTTSLESLLDEYTRRERIDEWKCEKCKGVGGVRTAYLGRRPNILVVYIDRRQDCNLFGKINRRVSFPLQFDLAPWLTKDSKDEDPDSHNGSGAQYSLYAMCVHQDLRGNTSSGHYVAFVRDRANRWHHLDDETVRPVSWSTVQEQHPYLLFYVTSSPISPSAPKGTTASNAAGGGQSSSEAAAAADEASKADGTEVSTNTGTRSPASASVSTAASGSCGVAAAAAAGEGQGQVEVVVESPTGAAARCIGEEDGEEEEVAANIQKQEHEHEEPEEEKRNEQDEVFSPPAAEGAATGAVHMNGGTPGLAAAGDEHEEPRGGGNQRVDNTSNTDLNAMDV